MTDVTVVEADALDSSPVAPEGATWVRAFDTGGVLLVRARLAAGVATGWHTHGERDAYGVVVAGRAAFDVAPEETLTAATGEFVRVPAGTAYRVRNPGDGEQVVLLALVGEGDPVVAAGAPSAPGPLRVAGEADLIPTGMLKNLSRLTPFPDAPVQQVRGHASGQVASEWHHHGDNDVFGHVLAGEGYVEWGIGPGERELARAGEFFRVPAGLVHRDVNPSDAEQDYVLWLTGGEPRIVHVDGPAGAHDRG